MKTLKNSGKRMSWNSRIMINGPFQIGIAVHQLAKLQMLESYDFLDHYLDRCNFQLIQMDMDSNYISANGLKDIVCLELCAEFETKKKQWPAWDKWSGRPPGLFKHKCEGNHMIALYVKCRW